MKCVFIVYNQANTERVEYMLDELGIRGFTFFEQVQGRGSRDGEPRRGTHTWPEMNSAMMTVVSSFRPSASSTTATARWACGPSSGISSRQSDFLNTIFDFVYLCAFI